MGVHSDNLVEAHLRAASADSRGDAMTESELRALVRRLHAIARECFDLQTIEQLRRLADEIERSLSVAESRHQPERDGLAR
jgi:hypothetical protein